MSVLLETSAGDLVIDLLLEEAPKTCLNFLKLCKSKYYNFAPIYNIQQPSFFQAGDPLYPIGDGGSSCWGLNDPAKQYFVPEKAKRNHERGSVSMVSSAKGLAGSQFFVSLNPNESFDRKHTVFGRLAEGFETLDVIASQPIDGEFRPLRDIRIKHTIILEDPFDDPPNFVGEPPESPLPTAAQLSTVRIGFDESLEETASIEEIEAKKRAREAEASALTLETLGDLPFASVRPPENILFVCKLNPVTSSEDLALIFGRFGKILSCQVVRDRRTGDSLQYAFIEFDLKEDAERGYFKMQGVLIDDRRIHVDFSQSVAKVSRSDLSSLTRGEKNEKSTHEKAGSASRARDEEQGRYGMVFKDEERPRRRSRSPRRDDRYKRERSSNHKHDGESHNPYRYGTSHRRHHRRSRSRDRNRRSKSRDS